MKNNESPLKTREDKKKPYKRKTVYIKRGFQARFAIKFLILIAVEAVLALGLFLYLSKSTVTVGYSGSELVLSNTRDYFLPALLLSNIVIVGITAVAGAVMMILVTHRLAGPLHRFEKSLEHISFGDLTYRFTLRKSDELKHLSGCLNDFTATMERSVAGIQQGLDDLGGSVRHMNASVRSGHDNGPELEAGLAEALKKLDALEKAAAFYKTFRSK